MSARVRGDTGSVTPLIVGMAAIVLGLLGVLTDASSAFLAKRAFAAAADGAALYAAGAVDRTQLYAGTTTDLPLDSRDATARAEAYLRRSGLADRYPGVTVSGVSVDSTGRLVSVAVSGTVRLPFTGVLSGGRATDVITAHARARSRLG